MHLKNDMTAIKSDMTAIKSNCIPSMTKHNYQVTGYVDNRDTKLAVQHFIMVIVISCFIISVYL